MHKIIIPDFCDTFEEQLSYLNKDNRNLVVDKLFWLYTCVDFSFDILRIILNNIIQTYDEPNLTFVEYIIKWLTNRQLIKNPLNIYDPRIDNNVMSQDKMSIFTKKITNSLLSFFLLHPCFELDYDDIFSYYYGHHCDYLFGIHIKNDILGKIEYVTFGDNFKFNITKPLCYFEYGSLFALNGVVIKHSFISWNTNFKLKIKLKNVGDINEINQNMYILCYFTTRSNNSELYYKDIHTGYYYESSLEEKFNDFDDFYTKNDVVYFDSSKM